jgi:hypothetical protein
MLKGLDMRERGKSEGRSAKDLLFRRDDRRGRQEGRRSRSEVRNKAGLFTEGKEHWGERIDGPGTSVSISRLMTGDPGGLRLSNEIKRSSFVALSFGPRTSDFLRPSDFELRTSSRPCPNSAPPHSRPHPHFLLCIAS